MFSRLGMHGTSSNNQLPLPMYQDDGGETSSPACSTPPSRPRSSSGAAALGPPAHPSSRLGQGQVERSSSGGSRYRRIDMPMVSSPPPGSSVGPRSESAVLFGVGPGSNNSRMAVTGMPTRLSHPEPMEYGGGSGGGSGGGVGGNGAGGGGDSTSTSAGGSAAGGGGGPNSPRRASAYLPGSGVLAGGSAGIALSDGLPRSPLAGLARRASALLATRSNTSAASSHSNSFTSRRSTDRGMAGAGDAVMHYARSTGGPRSAVPGVSRAGSAIGAHVSLLYTPSHPHPMSCKTA